MKINVISRKLIKPATPTPQNLNPYNISFIDELCPPMNIRILLFYRSGSASKQIPNLEESLAEILPKFYPLAGRFIEQNHTVDCSDQGAEFIEAEAAGVESMDLVRRMESDHLNLLLSRQFYQLNETATCALLSIQATHFRCGGVAIGVCVSHRICDASSLETFVLAWSENSGGGAAISPSLDSPTLFPRGDLDCTSSRDRSEILLNVSRYAKRFLLTNEAIARLRHKLRRGDGEEESGDRVISRVRAVCALIGKAMMSVDRARHGRSRPCLVSQAFNMRKRTAPPLPEHSCGNFAVFSVTRSMSAVETENMSVGGLVDVLGEAIDKTTSDCSRILSAGVDGLNEFILAPTMNTFEKSGSGETNVIWFSDWCKFGFDKIDFGWGKPVWTSIGPMAGENITVLRESEEGGGGGIEAWVYLKLNDMTYFEQDEGIRLFTKLTSQ